MAIEVPVRKEIASFQSRPVFGMTTRQLKCFGFAIPIGAGCYFLFSRLLGHGAAANITLFVVLPIFAFGLFKKNGYTMEKYLKIVWEHRFAEQKSLYKTENAIVLYMSEEEYQNDLARKMLAYTGKATSAQAETNITYHLSAKAEQRAVAMARAISRADAAVYRKTCARLAREAKRQKRRDRRAVAALKRRDAGLIETDVTYHLSAKEERRAVRLARADSRAEAAAYRKACTLRERANKGVLTHGNTQQNQSA